MKNLNMLIWLTQLGLSVAGPLTGFLLLAVWLRQRFALGTWVLIIGIIFGISGAVDGFRISMKAMEQMAEGKPEKKETPPVSFNRHS